MFQSSNTILHIYTSNKRCSCNKRCSWERFTHSTIANWLPNATYTAQFKYRWNKLPPVDGELLNSINMRRNWRFVKSESPGQVQVSSFHAKKKCRGRKMMNKLQDRAEKKTQRTTSNGMKRKTSGMRGGQRYQFDDLGGSDRFLSPSSLVHIPSPAIYTFAWVYCIPKVHTIYSYLPLLYIGHCCAWFVCFLINCFTHRGFTIENELPRFFFCRLLDREFMSPFVYIIWCSFFLLLCHIE